MQEWLIETVAHLGGYAASEVRIELRTPLEHQSNRLYDAWAGGRHLLVKEYLKPEEFSTGPFYEHRALVLLEPLDVAPRPVGIVPEHGPEAGPLVVYEYLEGEMWDRRTPTAAELAGLAQTWLQVHAISPDRVWQNERYTFSISERYTEFRASFLKYKAWTEAEYPAGMAGADLCLNVLERHHAVAEGLERLPPRLCFCRSDARFANVIQRPDGRIGLVDWEDSGLRDPAREILDLLCHPNQEDLLSPVEWESFLKPYLSTQTKLDPALPRRVQLYAAIYPMLWLALFFKLGIGRAQGGTLAGWTVNGLPANVRLRRYLARALAWPDPDFGRQLAELGDTSLFPS